MDFHIDHDLLEYGGSNEIVLDCGHKVLTIKVDVLDTVHRFYYYLLNKEKCLKLLKDSISQYRILRGECFYSTFSLFSVFWIDLYVYGYEVMIYLPKGMCVKFLESMNEYNNSIIKKYSDELCFLEIGKGINVVACELESFENFKKPECGGLSLYILYGEVCFDDLLYQNSRRFKSQFRKMTKASDILSIVCLSTLNIFSLDILDDFKIYSNIKDEENLITYNNFLDYCINVDYFEDEIVSDEFYEFVQDLLNDNKKIYIVLDFDKSVIKGVIKQFESMDIRLPNENLILTNSNACKNLMNTNSFDVFIYKLDVISRNTEIFNYLKFIGSSQDTEIYVDENTFECLNSCMKTLYKADKKTPVGRIKFLESPEYSTYEACVKQITNDYDVVHASETYILLNTPPSIRNMNLASLSAGEYRSIRDYVLGRLSSHGYQVKTCQMSYPCSPKDRSKKINSLTNKISSFDYRCDITCEIFHNFNIGVVVWSEMFSDRKQIDKKSLVGNNYIYRTTNGLYKFTTVFK